MPIEPHRIEAGALVFGQNSESNRAWALRVIAAAFPELAAGTAWVAPVTLTRDLAQVLDDLTWGEFMAAARDAHLSKGKDDDHG